MAAPIEDYALIGDCETAALVSREGSIDWLCWPRFDSGALFAALLGSPDNGRWIICPRAPDVRVRRRYRHNTLILETDFETDTGTVTLIDFMPPRFQSSRPWDTSHLVRIVLGRSGTVTMMTEFILRFDYGAIVPWISRLGATTLQAIAGPDMVVLRTRAPLRPDGYRHCADFTITAGDSLAFTLGYGPSHQVPPDAIDPFEALEMTHKTWEGWADDCHSSSDIAETTMRSLITLKALTHRPTGGIVAAPTTSLPELLGGSRNWDYRYCWLRDATFTLLALVTSGYHHEAAAWRSWLRRAVAGDPAQVQIMYGIMGERRLNEWQVPWLSGYEKSRPVRIGNAAANQLQLDIYGEVMDALYQASVHGVGDSPSDWDIQCALIEHLETVWQEPDNGLWEVRGRRRHFTHSKVMSWVAFDRAIKSVERFDVKGPVERWRNIRQQIHREVCSNGFDAKSGAFTQSYQSSALDASALLIPLVGFLPPSDPRVKSTVAAIEDTLMEGGLVLRYRPERSDDGLPGHEGAFLACSFWLVDNLVLLGRHQDARTLFERLLELRNDVGLFSEEYDYRSGRMVGNFPQAFSHVAHINTAHNLLDLSNSANPAERRADRVRR